MEPSEWKKPSEIMKTLRRRKSASQRRITTDSDKRTSVIYKSPSKSVKRKNPFHKDSPHPFPAKRQNICTDVKPPVSEGKDPLSCQLFTLLETTNDEERVISESEKAAQVLKQQQYNNVKSLNADRQTAVTTSKTSVPVPEPASDNVVSSYLPIDWCLKTKLRVVSSHPLNWSTQIRSTDESHGVKQFVQNSMQSDTENWEKRQFQSACMYWIHPNLPWMKLFPRIVDDVKSSMVASYLLQEDVQKALQADWEHSFTSAYHQLRSGLCPYFYLCTHQFTVLFYNQSKTQSGIVCLVTPTTRGFRELLENEGIEFQLPVGKKTTSPDKKENISNVDVTPFPTTEEKADKHDDCTEYEGDDILDNDDAASGWLESMGLDKKQFPTLDPKKVKMQREGFRVIDHRPESLVYIDSSNVQAFFNFLLNCRTCVAMSGSQAGLPPTVLSPTPFKGATLKSHKVKHTVVKQQGDRDSNIRQAHIVEVSGPILPHHSQQLVSLLHHTQNADFGMVFNNHHPTVPFNVLTKLCPKTVSQSSDISARSKYISPKLERDNSAKPVTNDDIEDGDKDKCVHIDDDDVKTGRLHNFHRPIPVADDRDCAIKEVVCTRDGFSWTT